MAQLLVDVTPFRATIKEAKGRPGVFEVEVLCKEPKLKTKTVEYMQNQS